MPCFAFLKGTCVKDRCPYSHQRAPNSPRERGPGANAKAQARSTPGPSSSSPRSQATVMCIHWSKGTCRFGDKCKFSHRQADSSHKPAEVATVASARKAVSFGRTAIELFVVGETHTMKTYVYTVSPKGRRDTGIQAPYRSRRCICYCPSQRQGTGAPSKWDYVKPYPSGMGSIGQSARLLPAHACRTMG